MPTPSYYAADTQPKKGMSGLAKTVITVIALFGAFLMLGFFAESTPEGKERSRDRAAIDLCRKEQADELQSLSTRRMTRTMCDAMTQRFIDRWGHTP